MDTTSMPDNIPTIYPDEQWRFLRDSSYAVSTHGRVKAPRGNILKPSAHPRTGHLHVRVRQGDALKHRPVHHLVLETFVGPRPLGAIARHLNDVPTDNHPENLAWGTHAENARDSVVNGGNANVRKTQCPRGHDLTGENLIPSGLAEGRRRCLACHREWSIARNHKRPFSKQGADAYYASIVGASA